jgi:nucleoside-diphosphate-sugar epimerase
MRVVITGGAGFIGSAVCRYLVGDVGVSVLNIDMPAFNITEGWTCPGFVEG